MAEIIVLDDGSLATVDPVNANFAALNEDIKILSEDFAAIDSTIETKIKNSEKGTDEKISNIINAVNAIGQPIIRMNDVLNDNEIRLEGAEVSKTTYAALYSVYGDKHGTSTDGSKFVLPDYRNRTFWGKGEEEEYGLIEAGLPNIEGKSSTLVTDFSTTSTNGAIKSVDSGGNTVKTADHTKRKGYIEFNANNYCPIYGNSDTVQPAAIKIRVVTRYK